MMHFRFGVKIWVKRENLNRPGIYKIVNKITLKIYVGSSKNIRKRWKAHRNGLRQGRHHNIYLYSAYKKYGKDNFLWEVIEFVDDLELLIEREQYWLTFYKSYDREVGYNLSPTAYSCLGVKHTEQARKNMSLSHMGHKRTKEANEKIRKSQWKRVYQLDMSGNVIAEYPSILSAEEKTGVSRQLISMCCRKITKSAKGFFWSFERDDKPIKKQKSCGQRT